MNEKDFERLICETESKISDIKKILENESYGSLVIQEREGRKYYYRKVIDDVGKQTNKYIPKANREEAKRLAQKAYYKKLLPYLERNLLSLKTFYKKYIFDAEKKVFEGMDKLRLELLDPLDIEKKKYVEKWIGEQYTPNLAYQENLRYETNRGEYVRSKSEVLIANVLETKKDAIVYCYERPLKLLSGKRYVTLYPDFSIINLKTGKVVYWEHFGLMDDTQYVSEFIWKYNLFQENGLKIGEDIMFTFESDRQPFDMKLVKKIVDKICD